MATLMTDLERNDAADEVASAITHLSLHTSTPGITGANEATGGIPPYARKAVTISAAGVEGPLGVTLQPATVGIAWSDELTFDVDADDYTHWGSWTDVSAGVFCIANVILPVTQTLETQGQIKLSIGIGSVAGA